MFGTALDARRVSGISIELFARPNQLVPIMSCVSVYLAWLRRFTLSTPRDTLRAMDTRNVFAKLFSSRAFAFAMLMLVLVAALVALGKAPYAELVAMAKWLGVTFVGSKSLESIVSVTRANAQVKDQEPPQ